MWSTRSSPTSRRCTTRGCARRRVRARSRPPIRTASSSRSRSGARTSARCWCASAAARARRVHGLADARGAEERAALPGRCGHGGGRVGAGAPGARVGRAAQRRQPRARARPRRAASPRGAPRAPAGRPPGGLGRRAAQRLRRLLRERHRAPQRRRACKRRRLVRRRPRPGRPGRGSHGQRSRPALDARGERQQRVGMKLGFLTVLYADRSLHAVLDRAVELGVDAIELGTGNYPGDAHCRPDELLADHTRARELRRAVAERGLQISALSCHGNPLHPNREIADAHHAVWRRTLELAELLEVDVVNTFSGCPGDGPDARAPNWVTSPWPPDFAEVLGWQWDERAIPYWREEAERAGAHGVRGIG